MIIDKQNMVASAQAVTASAASTDYIDLGAARDLGLSMGLRMHVVTNTTATAAGAATVQFQLQFATDAAFTTPVIVSQTDAIGKAALVAGASFVLPIPPGSQYRYCRVYFNVGTGPLTAGAFTAFVTTALQKASIYPIAPNA